KDKDRRRRSRSRSRSRSDSAPGSRSKGKHLGVGGGSSTSEERAEAAKRAQIDELTRDQRTVFVNQLTMKVSENDLKRYFGALGEVNNVIMLRDKFTNRHKVQWAPMCQPMKPGFAYVEMKSLDSVPLVLDLNERVPDFQKFPVMVKASEAEKNYLAKQEEKAKNPNQPGVILGNAAAIAGLKLHMGGLHANITEDDLNEICRSFGEVTQLVLHRDEKGESKKFAFVTFAEKESASACREKLNGMEVAGKALIVSTSTIHVTMDVSVAVTFICHPLVSVSNCHPEPNSSEASSNWKLDDDEGEGIGMKMDSSSRSTLMARLGSGLTPAQGIGAQGGGAQGMGNIPHLSGVTIPMPQPPVAAAPAPAPAPAPIPSAAASAALAAALSGSALGGGSGSGGAPPLGGQVRKRWGGGGGGG
ncbi:unnamed protein product, partial [Discosporangium mesarthrocarpum]